MNARIYLSIVGGVYMEKDKTHLLLEIYLRLRLYTILKAIKEPSTERNSCPNNSCIAQKLYAYN